MSQKPYFSVIIPTLNEEKNLPLILKDLIPQTFSDFEVIIVDGHSDDQTIANIKPLTPKLPQVTVLNSEIRNVSTQRNFGASKAQGEYLIFCDADDRLPYHFLEGVKYQISKTKAPIFTTSMNDNLTNKKHVAIISLINFYTRIQQKTTSPYVVEALFGFKKTVFDRLKGFNSSLPIAEGGDILKRARQLGYHFTVFDFPRYTFSLRRMNKEGSLKMAINIAQIELSRLLKINISDSTLKKLYPMKGGNYYSKK